MKISYNAPVSLTFSLLCFAALLLSFVTGGETTRLFFSLPGTMTWSDPLAWVRLLTHPLGHANWEHLFGNISFILLLGPILEEKYSSASVLLMMIITTLVTSILNLFLFSTGLLGASGMVFMFILLSSFTNIRSGEIPLTFIAIVALYVSREVIQAFQDDSISQFAHIIGGACGSIFGFVLGSGKGKETHV